MVRLTSLFIFLFLLISCSTTVEDLRSNVVLNPSTWTEQISSPLEKRILNSNSKELSEFIVEWKDVNQVSFKGHETQKKISNSDIRTNLRQLPKMLYDYLDKNVAAIILSDSLSIPVAVQPLRDPNTKEITGKYLILIDSKVNTLGLNDWYKWREYSAFGEPETDFNMEAYLSHKNEVKDTLDYILSQSIALILAWDKTIFPRDITKTPIANITFLKRSWINNKGIIQSHHDKLLDEIRYISYYGESSRTFPRDKIYNFYQRLDKTNFTNLYATTGATKDFVESMATYIHVFIFRRPYHIDFYENEVLLDSFSHCLNKPRCLRKKQDLSNIVKKHLQ
jgi:hypothetical protein